VQRRNATIFITFSTSRRWILPESVRSDILRCCTVAHATRFDLHAAVVMPDHVHLLLTPRSDADGNPHSLAQITNSIKGASAHAVNNKLGRVGRVWTPESFDHVLRSDESARSKAEYICANPVRAGLCASEGEYPWVWREWVEGLESQ
jgi:REP element-mobilizing transposase RayT